MKKGGTCTIDYKPLTLSFFRHLSEIVVCFEVWKKFLRSKRLKAAWCKNFLISLLKN